MLCYNSPDKCKSPVTPAYATEEMECSVAMNRVSLAYEVLGDEDKRILYDAGGMDLVKEGVGGDEQQGGMDPFAALFGGGRQQRHSNKGPDASVSHEVTLEDIYNGNDLEMHINRRVVCRGCSKGKAKDKEKCKSCGKCPDETRMVQKMMGPGMIVQQEERVASKEKCKVEDTALKTTIERGIADNAEIKFPRKSEQSPGQVRTHTISLIFTCCYVCCLYLISPSLIFLLKLKVPGDVLMTLKTRKHHLFTRDGNDLHMTMTISLKEALLGFSKTITHLDNHEVEVSKKGTTKPMSVKKIKGEGMCVHNFPSDFGDLHVKFVVDIPTKLTPEQTEAISNLF